MNFKSFSSVSSERKLYNREEVEEFFSYMDRDYDGRLSFEEFMGEECTIEKLFKNMDKNGDGYVSKQVRGKMFLVCLDYLTTLSSQCAIYLCL